MRLLIYLILLNP